MRVADVAHSIELSGGCLLLGGGRPASSDGGRDEPALRNVVLGGLAGVVVDVVVALALDGLDSRTALLVSGDGPGNGTYVRLEGVDNVVSLPLTDGFEERGRIEVVRGGRAEQVVDFELVVIFMQGLDSAVVVVLPSRSSSRLGGEVVVRKSEVLQDSAGSVRPFEDGALTRYATTGGSKYGDFAVVRIGVGIVVNVVYFLARFGVWRGIDGAGVLRVDFVREKGSPPLQDGGAAGNLVSVRVAVVEGRLAHR